VKKIKRRGGNVMEEISEGGRVQSEKYVNQVYGKKGLGKGGSPEERYWDALERKKKKKKKKKKGNGWGLENGQTRWGESAAPCTPLTG